MIALEDIRYETFEPLLGKVFKVGADGGVELVLTDVKHTGERRNETVREPFSLLFAGSPELIIPQAIHRFECAELGAMEIFITQVSGGAKGSEFQAIFS